MHPSVIPVRNPEHHNLFCARQANLPGDAIFNSLRFRKTSLIYLTYILPVKGPVSLGKKKRASGRAVKPGGFPLDAPFG